MHEILSQYSPYYLTLSTGEQSRFRSRVAEFVAAKDWRTREDFDLTDEHKIRIAAVAIELTFGLRVYLLEHFEVIIIYPGAFRPKGARSARHGELHTAGAIALSWQAFEFGSDDPNDGKHVGLHEFAHALNVADMMQKSSDPHFSGYFPKWYMVARHLLLSEKESLLWLLSGRTVPNLEELFAVTIEHFFEQPQALLDQSPALYLHTSLLLGQGPLGLGIDLAPPKAREDQLGALQRRIDVGWKMVAFATGLYSLIFFVFFAGFFILGSWWLLLPYLLIVGLINSIPRLSFSRTLFYQKGFVLAGHNKRQVYSYEQVSKIERVFGKGPFGGGEYLEVTYLTDEGIKTYVMTAQVDPERFDQMAQLWARNQIYVGIEGTAGRRGGKYNHAPGRRKRQSYIG